MQKRAVASRIELVQKLKKIVDFFNNSQREKPFENIKQRKIKLQKIIITI